MPRSGHLYAVVYTWRQHKIVPTKAEGQREMRAWKDRYEADGWIVRSLPAAPGFKARHPETGEEHAIALHTYDRETRERLWTPPKTPKPRSTEQVGPKPTKRSGRKPVGA